MLSYVAVVVVDNSIEMTFLHVIYRIFPTESPFLAKEEGKVEMGIGWDAVWRVLGYIS